MLTIGAVGWTVASWLQSQSWVRVRRDRLITAGTSVVGLGIAVCAVVAFFPLAPGSGGRDRVAARRLRHGPGDGQHVAGRDDVSPVDDQGRNAASLNLGDALGSSIFIGVSGSIFAALRTGGDLALTFGAVMAAMALVATARAAGLAAHRHHRDRAQVASIRGAVRNGTDSDRAIRVEARITVSSTTIWSITRCRSGVRTGDDPAPQVATAGDGPALQQFGNRRQTTLQALPAGVLGDLQRDEGRHAVAERGRRDAWRPAGDHAVALQPVEPRLHRAPGDPQPATRLEDAEPRLDGEQAEQIAVELVDRAVGDGHVDLVGLEW